MSVSTEDSASSALLALNRPAVLPVIFANIPVELRREARWCVWKYVLKNKRGAATWAKVPVNCATGEPAKSNDPSTWGDYDTAFDATLSMPGLSGLGFFLGDGWVGIDVDDCYDVLNGFNPLASSILNTVEGYAEYSPSGKGVKVFTKGEIPGSKADHAIGLEIYDSGRFFAVTGHSVPGRVNAVPVGAVPLTDLYVQHFGAFGLNGGGSGVNNDDPLVNAKNPLSGWDIERARTEVLNQLQPDCHYSEWIEVGAALHHQGGGDDEWLELWDEWSADAPERYEDGACAAKWETFSEQRSQGRGPITLATLIKRAQDSELSQKFDRTEHWHTQMAATSDRKQLLQVIPQLIARDSQLDAPLREELAVALQARLKSETGVRHPIKTVRSWLVPVHETSEIEENTPDWAKEHVYVTDDESFVNLKTKAVLSRTSFNACYSRRMTNKDDEGRVTETAVEAALDRWKIDVVTRRAYHPLLPAIFEMGGALHVNTYRDDLLPEIPVVLLDEEEEAIRFVRAHISNLLPDEREAQLFLSWLAFVVQNPGVKVRWAPYLCGPQGDGKSFFTTLLAKAMGELNVRPLTGGVLESSTFTDWAVGHAVICIEELKLHGHNKFDAINRLKPYITNENIDVHPKGRPTYPALNATQYCVFSNFLDGAPITDEDRRFMFLRSRFNKASLNAFRAANPRYRQTLFDSAKNYPGAMRSWLMGFRDFHPDFDPNDDAPITAMRQLVIDMSQSDIDVACQDVLREGAPGVTATWVASAFFVDAVAGLLGDGYGMGRQKLAGIVTQFLASNGFNSMGPEKHRIGPNHVQSRFWVHESVGDPVWGRTGSAVVEASFVRETGSDGFLD